MAYGRECAWIWEFTMTYILGFKIHGYEKQILSKKSQYKSCKKNFLSLSVRFFFNFSKKEALAQVFSFEFSEIFKNTSEGCFLLHKSCKSLIKSIRCNCQKICSLSRVPNTKLEIRKKQKFVALNAMQLVSSL